MSRRSVYNVNDIIRQMYTISRLVLMPDSVDLLKGMHDEIEETLKRGWLLEFHTALLALKEKMQNDS